MSVPDRQTPDSFLFGHYEIIETLGQGGMGVVYRAVDLALDRAVVLKVLREDLRHRGQIVARFRREAEAIAALDHPHIVHIYSVGEIEGIPYMAMEYVEALSLSEILERDGPMPWPRALEVGAQIAAALARAHEQGIIHRDVKPGNVLIDKSGKAYVTDFGIAKVLSAATQLTIEGQRLGTPQYMCPERCRNGEVTPLSDVYSLGVLLFQAISGRLPHEAVTPGQLMHRIVTEPAARLRAYVPEAPEDVERLLAFLLEANPRHRPQSAAVVVDAIARVREGRPLSDQNEAATALTSYQKSFNTPPANTPTGSSSVVRRAKPRPRPAAVIFHLLIALSIGAALAFTVVAFTAPPPAVDLPAQLWTPPPAVAEMIPETGSVTLARIALADFEIGRLSMDGNRGVVAQLEGMAATSRAGQRALVAMDTTFLGAAVLQTPLPNQGAQGFDLLPVLGVAPPGAFLTTSTATFRMGSALAAPEILLTEQSTAVAFQPDGKQAVAARWAEHAAVVAIVDPATTATLLECRIPGGQVTQLSYGAGNAVIARQEVTGSTGTLYACFTEGTTLTSRVLLDQALPLGPAPQHPISGELVAAVAAAQGSEILVIDPASGTVELRLGSGRLAAWAADGSAVIALDEDRAGRLQLWQIDTIAPHARRQLTFLDSGLEDVLAMRPGTTTAYTALPGTATVVRVDLSAAQSPLPPA